MNQQQVIQINERASLDRPAWSSMVSTGLFEAYKHLHVGMKKRGDAPVRRGFFERGRR